MFDITIIGDITKDTLVLIDKENAELIQAGKPKELEVCFPFGHKIPVKEILESFGGNALNVSFGFARLNLKTNLVTRLGRDKKNQQLEQTLKQEGISTLCCQYQEKVENNHSIIIIFQQERTILTYHENLEYEFLPLPESEWTYLTSLGQNSENYLNQIKEWLKDSHSKLIFQPGTYQLQLGNPKLKSILELTEIFIANYQEYQKILNISETNKQELLKLLADQGPKFCLLTDGVSGVELYDGADFYHLDAWLGRKVIEPTGAGDAFSAGFSGAIIKGQPIEQALKWGIINSGRVVEYFGAQAGLMTQAEIGQVLKSESINQVKKVNQ